MSDPSLLKKDFLNGEAASAGNRGGPEPEPAERIIPTPQSIALMGHILVEIAISGYELEPDDFDVDPLLLGTLYRFQLLPLDRGEPLNDIFEEPEIYSKLRQFCSDMMGEDADNALTIDPEMLFIQTPDKMTLFKVLKAYLENPEYGLRTQENGFAGKKADLDSDDLIEAVEENDDLRAVLFGNMNSRPHSLSSYHAAMMSDIRNDVSISLDHLYKVICHEEHIVPEETHDHAPIYGGFA